MSKKMDVWAVVWRDGSAIEGVSVFDTAHNAVRAIINVYPHLKDEGRFEKDGDGNYTGAEDENADTEFDDWWLESCRVNE